MKVLEWLTGISYHIRLKISEDVCYSSKVYSLVFWAALLGLLHLVLSPALYFQKLGRQLLIKYRRRTQADQCESDDIPF